MTQLRADSLSHSSLHADFTLKLAVTYFAEMVMDGAERHTIFNSIHSTDNSATCKSDYSAPFIFDLGLQHH